MKAAREPAGVFLALLACYVLTATRTIQGGDAAEFTWVALRGGVPHPPGYPLYVLLSRIFAELPLGPVPFRVALLSATAGAAAAALLTHLVASLTGGRLAAVAAGLCFGFAPITWKLSGIPEVFTLNALIVVLTMSSVIRLRSVLAEGDRRAALAHLAVSFGLLGLGLANHHTAVSVAPFCVWGLAMVVRAWGRNTVLPSLGIAVGSTMVGLLPYVYLPLAAAGDDPHAWVWGDPRSVTAVLDHFLRTHYGTFSLGLYERDATPLANLAAFWGALPPMLLYLYFIAGVAGAAVLWRRERWTTVMLGMSILASGVILLAMFNLPPGAVGDAVAERFHLLPLLFFSVLVGAGVAALAVRLTSPVGRLALLLPLPFMALEALGPASWASEPSVERVLEASLNPVAPDAVIVGVGDLESFGFPYLVHGKSVRGDVVYLDAHLLRTRWYHARAQRRLPDVPLPFDENSTRMPALLETIRARRPVYLTPSLAARTKNVPLFPEGLLFRVNPPGGVPPPPDQVEATVHRATHAIGPLPGVPLDPWSRYVRARGADVWTTLAATYARAGDEEAASRCRARARSLAGFEL